MKALSVLSVAVLAAGCRHASTQSPKGPTPVNVTAVQQITPQTGERYSASIVPNRQVSLAFRVSGVVASIQQAPGPGGRLRALEIGDMVKAGTELARLRAKDYDLQVGQAGGQVAEARQSEAAARAQVAQAEATALRASQDFQRATFLFENHSLTRTDYDAARAQHDATRAQVDAARAQLQGVAARIATSEAAAGTAALAKEDTVLSAPFTAAVLQRNIEIGGLAGPSSPAFSLAEIGTVKAAFGVPDGVAILLKPGLTRRLQVEAMPDRVFTGTVGAIAAAADASTRLFQVEMTIPNPDHRLRPGMIVSLSLATEGGARQVAVVPLSAIIRAREAGGFAVMVVMDGRARRREVSLGRPYGDRIETTSGVSTGDRVITRGASQLAEGEPVEVIP